MQNLLKLLLDFCFEMEFYLKIAVSCTMLQQVFYLLLNNLQLNLISQVLFYWLIGSISFYAIGFFIERFIKTKDNLTKKLSARVNKVKKQSFPAFTLKGMITGEIKSLIAALIILYLAPEVHRGNSLLLNLGWFLMRIVAADFCFYISHRILHTKSFLKIHLKHHEFQDSSSFVAGHKSFLEYIIVTITDILPIFIFGYDITQLCAWTLIGNIYNLEGHSSLSILFIPSDFHDLHHTSFQGNYGIQSFWDRVFKTLNPITKKTGIMFPVNSIESKLK
ncbi:sterol desaturase family protein [Aphanizomenon sp. CS-733/32]|uniref:sterol desaturase family protein n=1 Tax=Aphanizomenon sp. CS-733/32 TaxID=3021715 RepID=UPI00232D010E|nr:sterol desaturase family protein [Aphanizomenon sp. CS-733/32]